MPMTLLAVDAKRRTLPPGGAAAAVVPEWDFDHSLCRITTADVPLEQLHDMVRSERWPPSRAAAPSSGKHACTTPWACRQRSSPTASHQPSPVSPRSPRPVPVRPRYGAATASLSLSSAPSTQQRPRRHQSAEPAPPGLRLGQPTPNVISHRRQRPGGLLVDERPGVAGALHQRGDHGHGV